jgi:hypothetical protein
MPETKKQPTSLGDLVSPKRGKAEGLPAKKYPVEIPYAIDGGRIYRQIKADFDAENLSEVAFGNLLLCFAYSALRAGLKPVAMSEVGKVA